MNPQVSAAGLSLQACRFQLIFAALTIALIYGSILFCVL
jgi:ammonia channel protein AmtB